MSARLACIALCLFISRSLAQDCLYNETMCACSFGSTEGTCYERVGANTAGVDLCEKRACDAGWTCDCEGDYYCKQTDVTVYTLLDFDDFDIDTARCIPQLRTTVISSGFELGYWHPLFSDLGLLSQNCQLFAWWFDGELQNNFASPTLVLQSNLANVRLALTDWNNLPLTSGSLIAFRIRDAPFACYSGLSTLNINGTITDTNDDTAVTQRFSSDFEDDWFATDFVEGSNWREPTDSEIGQDFDLSNLALTNTYWRIKVK